MRPPRIHKFDYVLWALVALMVAAFVGTVIYAISTTLTVPNYHEYDYCPALVQQK